MIIVVCMVVARSVLGQRTCANVSKKSTGESMFDREGEWCSRHCLEHTKLIRCDSSCLKGLKKKDKTLTEALGRKILS